MPVFISHRTIDDRQAREVYSRLTGYGIPCYLDDLDDQSRAARGTLAVTSLILSRLPACTNLLAVVTRNTESSWWVPFEIGAARQAPRSIATLTELPDVSLPSYLLEWPRLRGVTAVDSFARLYLAQQTTLNEKVLLRSAGTAAALSAASAFDAQLRAALAQ
jgi:hypothetical protein